jgi:homoserine dehydrogenase
LSLGVDIIGFGPIGRELARKLISDELKKSFEVVSITDSSGTIYPKTLADVLKAIEWKTGNPGQKLSSSGLEKHGGKSSDSQIVIDVTTSDYDKAEEAKKRATNSLESGKNFVTANKVALAYYFSEIFELARKKNLTVGYGATICGGIHAISIARKIRGDEITSASAVLNASTTLILSMLEENPMLSFEEACKKAAETGVLEKDWGVDLDGLDAGAKTAILANVLFPDSKLSLGDIVMKGIRDDRAQLLIRYVALKRGEADEKIRLVSEIKSDGASVEPKAIKTDSPLAVTGRFNAVVLETKTLGEIAVRNLGGGVELTASVIISDLRNVANSHKKN